ncbi:MAG: TIGR04282 family arsenosugar biosynthesis glycosyltransferase [Anaerolineae bacterium]|jgi:hypothetical protein|nr:TIGR04282 family arsenosugar biosynthesis glycosyltransferase [Anaerolineae bacterium]
MKRHLIIYARRPLARYVKTRLGAEIGDEEAAGVYGRLLYTLLCDVACADLPDTTLEIAVAAPEDVAYFRDAFPEFTVHPQTVGDLGERISASFALAYSEGAASVVLTGSDIPELTAAVIQEAFSALERRCAPGVTPGVIGPAADGGYYLIGMYAPGAPLFRGIAWSTSRVLAQTEALARSHQVALASLPELADVDVGADYKRWRATIERSRAHSSGAAFRAADAQRDDA